MIPFQEILDLLAIQASKAPQALQDSKDSQALRDLKDSQVLKVPILDPQDHQVSLVDKDLGEIQASQEMLETLGLMVLLDL